MAAEISATDSSLSGRSFLPPALFKRCPSSALPFPPLAARSRRRIRARAVLRSLRHRRRAPFRRRRRSGLPPYSATPPSASPCCRRPRPPLRFARRLPERRRPRHPDLRCRLPPLRPPFSSSSLSRGEPRTAVRLPPSLLSLGRRSAAPVVAGGDHRGAGAPLPSAAPARPPSGAPSRLPSGPGRQPPAPAGAADARDPRRRPPPAACARSTVDRGADAWAPLPVDPVRAPRSLG
uniref:HGWP repeat containing protein-like n=1 Tax=Oryza sativa subsp. japonica TaxID=39947 RepID=Q5Z4T4_ORYSJ|nr:HGWP repeat containing protein-like [Oryza sativa Japonica Group]